MGRWRVVIVVIEMWVASDKCRVGMRPYWKKEKFTLP